MYPKAVTKLEEVESGVMEFETKWRRMEKGLGGRVQDTSGLEDGGVDGDSAEEHTRPATDEDG